MAYAAGRTSLALIACCAGGTAALLPQNRPIFQAAGSRSGDHIIAATCCDRQPAARARPLVAKVVSPMKARQRNERSRQNEGRVVPTNKWSMQLDNLLLQSDGGKSRLHTVWE